MTKPKHPRDYKKRGAPEWEYDSILAEEICDAIAVSTDSMKEILEAHPHFPSEKVIRKWRFRIPTFGQMYAQAKMAQAELFAEEVIKISDDKTLDSKIDKDGNEVCNTEYIARSRLRVDTRKWIACKLAPRIYGDRQIIDHNVSHETSLKDLG